MSGQRGVRGFGGWGEIGSAHLASSSLSHRDRIRSPDYFRPRDRSHSLYFLIASNSPTKKPPSTMSPPGPAPASWPQVVPHPSRIFICTLCGWGAVGEGIHSTRANEGPAGGFLKLKRQGGWWEKSTPWVFRRSPRSSEHPQKGNLNALQALGPRPPAHSIVEFNGRPVKTRMVPRSPSQGLGPWPHRSWHPAPPVSLHCPRFRRRRPRTHPPRRDL